MFCFVLFYFILFYFLLFILFSFIYFIFLFYFLLFRAAPRTYGSSQARGQIGTVATGLHHIHSNTSSEPCLQPPIAHGHAGSLTHRARPGIEPASSWILVRLFSAKPRELLVLLILYILGSKQDFPASFAFFFFWSFAKRGGSFFLNNASRYRYRYRYRYSPLEARTLLLPHK